VFKKNHIKSKGLKLFASCLLAGLLSACGGGSSDGITAYTAVVDAGSSGSRIYLYSSTANGDFGTIQTLFDYAPKNLTGLSSFSNAPSQAGPQEIQPLLNYLNSFLAGQKLLKSQVSINVLATAGMRTVDPATSSAIYQSVTNSIVSSGYAPAKVETISGQNEGLYSWADINYLEGALQAKTTPYGIVEIGGASAQIAYISSDLKNPNILTITINGVPYSIFSISYLGLGQNSARQAMINSQAAGGGLINNACYTSNYQFGANPGDPGPAPGVTSLTGAYDYSKCSTLYTSVINGFNVSGTANAAGFNTARFLAIGGSVSGAIGNWGLTNQAPTVLASQVQTYCQSASWANFLATFGAFGATKFLQPQCANSTYLSTFLYGPSALSLGANQLSSITDINGTVTTWTLGYVLISQFSH